MDDRDKRLTFEPTFFALLFIWPTEQEEWEEEGADLNGTNSDESWKKMIY